MSRSPGTSALVEAAVLEAARRVFAERGFAAASVDAVAESAGLTKGAVYSRFASKEALFLAAAKAHDEDVLAGIHGTTPDEWARSWARGLEAQRRWTLLGLEFRLYGLRNPAASDETRDWQRTSHERLRLEIERRLDEAGAALSIDADAAASLLAAVAAGLAQQHFTDADVDVEALMKTAIELLTQQR